MNVQKLSNKLKLSKVFTNYSLHPYLHLLLVIELAKKGEKWKFSVNIWSLFLLLFIHFPHEEEKVTYWILFVHKLKHNKQVRRVSECERGKNFLFDVYLHEWRKYFFVVWPFSFSSCHTLPEASSDDWINELKSFVTNTKLKFLYCHIRNFFLMSMVAWSGLKSLIFFIALNHNYKFHIF